MTSPAALDDLTWPEGVQDWIAAWALFEIEFSADDLRLHFRAAPHGNMVGAAFRAAAQAKLIRRVGYKESSTPPRKHSLIHTWIGRTEGVTK